VLYVHVNLDRSKPGKWTSNLMQYLLIDCLKISRQGVSSINCMRKAKQKCSALAPLGAMK